MGAQAHSLHRSHKARVDWNADKKWIEYFFYVMLSSAAGDEYIKNHFRNSMKRDLYSYSK